MTQYEMLRVTAEQNPRLRNLGGVMRHLTETQEAGGSITESGSDSLRNLLREYQATLYTHAAHQEREDLFYYARLGEFCNPAAFPRSDLSETGLRAIDRETPYALKILNASLQNEYPDTGILLPDELLNMDYEHSDVTPIVLIKAWMDELRKEHLAYLPMVIYQNVYDNLADDNTAWVKWGARLLSGTSRKAQIEAEYLEFAENFWLDSLLKALPRTSTWEATLHRWVRGYDDVPLLAPIMSLFNHQDIVAFETTQFNKLTLRCGEASYEIRGRNEVGPLTFEDHDSWKNATCGNIMQLMMAVATHNNLMEGRLYQNYVEDIMREQNVDPRWPGAANILHLPMQSLGAHTSLLSELTKTLFRVHGNGLA